jgi:Gram-negative bacterial TonB protein C-terminal
MDVNPGPVMAITPPRGIVSSFVTIPGERVIDSPGMTVHVRRAVRVPSERWIWSRRKQLAMGELATRIDPQAAHQPASGSITVQAMIDKEGRVTDLKPLNGSFSFLPGVARAVREWRYEPTYLDGKPVETRAEIEINFHLASAASHP